MSLTLTDRSIKYPRGIVENLLVKVDKFIFPMNFVVLDMEADKKVPIILGRPFLRTSRALIDVLAVSVTLGYVCFCVCKFKPITPVLNLHSGESGFGKMKRKLDSIGVKLDCDRSAIRSESG
ncbi:hypothetical protein QVD17_19950 [Tagetes erecta]|uniref:Uncharacterized protein n=1 Tax=Tagetes erecta TaxID=13708 RepID=A0AAD8KQP2_TARER|nr:hypothetical protein QVD17_19950 [Tagetes erecta]